MAVFLQIAMCFAGVYGFSVLFQTPRRLRLYCGFTGAAGWLVYLMLRIHFDLPYVGAFAAAMALTMISRRLAVQLHATTAVFLVCGIFPLVPGAGIYYTAYHFVMGENAEAVAWGIDSIKMAVAICLGIGAAYSLPDRLFGWKVSADIWTEDSEIP